MMMKHICMVNGIKLQNPSPKALAVCVTGEPNAIAATATMITASTANTYASGIQRSDHAQQRSEMRSSQADGWRSMIRSIYCRRDKRERATFSHERQPTWTTTLFFG